MSPTSLEAPPLIQPTHPPSSVLGALKAGATGVLEARWTFLGTLASVTLLMGLLGGALIGGAAALYTTGHRVALVSVYGLWLAGWLTAACFLLLGLSRINLGALDGDARVGQLFGGRRQLLDALIVWGLLFVGMTWVDMGVGFVQGFVGPTAKRWLTVIPQVMEVLCWVSVYWILLHVVGRGLRPLAAIAAAWTVFLKRMRVLISLALIYAGLLTTAFITANLLSPSGTAGILPYAIAGLLVVVVSLPVMGVALASVFREASEPPPTPTPLLVVEPVPPNAWLGRLGLLLLFPCMVYGGEYRVLSDWGIAILSGHVDISSADMRRALTAVLVVTSLSAVAILVRRHGQGRGVSMDEEGVLFDASERWAGTRLRWEAIRWFCVHEGGVQLRVEGQPWTAWFGTFIRTEDRQTHEAVELLEAHGVARRS